MSSTDDRSRSCALLGIGRKVGPLVPIVVAEKQMPSCLLSKWTKVVG
jgi:hypothetical protein